MTGRGGPIGDSLDLNGSLPAFGVLGSVGKPGLTALTLPSA